MYKLYGKNRFVVQLGEKVRWFKLSWFLNNIYSKKCEERPNTDIKASLMVLSSWTSGRQDAKHFVPYTRTEQNLAKSVDIVRDL